MRNVKKGRKIWLDKTLKMTRGTDEVAGSFCKKATSTAIPDTSVIIRRFIQKKYKQEYRVKIFS